MRPMIFVMLVATLSLAQADELKPKPPQKKGWPVHPHYQEFLDQHFTHYEFKRLKDDERARYFSIYDPDPESQEKLEIDFAILGEAPPFAKAKQDFPLCYPAFGRMRNVRGTLLWQEKPEGKTGLVFQTETQRYCVDEYHLIERLERHGWTKKSEPREIIFSACWHFDQLFGLYLIYVETMEFHSEQESGVDDPESKDATDDERLRKSRPDYPAH